VGRSGERQEGKLEKTRGRACIWLVCWEVHVGRDGCAVEAVSTQCGPMGGSSRSSPALRADIEQCMGARAGTTHACHLFARVSLFECMHSHPYSHARTQGHSHACMHARTRAHVATHSPRPPRLPSPGRPPPAPGPLRARQEEGGAAAACTAACMCAAAAAAAANAAACNTAAAAACQWVVGWGAVEAEGAWV